MARVAFTSNLRALVECPTLDVAGTTVREALDAVFAQVPRLRGYIVDETGALREHMIVFVNGEPAQDRRKLSDAIATDASIYVMQALSGG
jgi:sulfur-carrier protein